MVALLIVVVLWLTCLSSSQEESCNGGRRPVARLTGSRSSHAGRVEVSWSPGLDTSEEQDSESWWPVCGDESWTDYEAGVVCRQLQFTYMQSQGKVLLRHAASRC